MNGAEATPLKFSQDMVECASGDLDFLNTITTGNESLVYGYDTKLKVQSS